MFSIEYKRLFEVRVVHDYYLIGSNGQSVFALGGADRAALLTRQIQTGRYDISKDLTFLMNEAGQKKFRDYRLRFAPTPTGFYVGMQVRQEAAPGGGRRYRPFIPPRQNDFLAFGLAAHNSLFSNITSIRTGLDDGLLYDFSNAAPRVPGTLSSPPPNVVSGGDYEMGDIALEGGALSQALQDNTGDDAAQWAAIPGEGLVHQGERVLDTAEDDYQAWLLGFGRPPGPHFGLVRLFFEPPAPGTPLMDDDGYLATQLPAGATHAVHPVFELRFLSRPTYWRYQRREGLTTTEIDDIQAAMPGWFTEDGARVVTTRPRPLARSLTGFPPLPGPGTPVFFTNPSPALFSKEQGRMFSDVFFTKANPMPL